MKINTFEIPVRDRLQGDVFFLTCEEYKQPYMVITQLHVGAGSVHVVCLRTGEVISLPETAPTSLLKAKLGFELP